MERQRKLEALRIAELNYQKTVLEREISSKASADQAQERARRLSDLKPAQCTPPVLHGAPAITDQQLRRMRMANRTKKQNSDIGHQVTWYAEFLSSAGTRRNNQLMRKRIQN